MVYFIQEANNPSGLIKIGFTDSIKRRLSCLQSGSPVILQVLNVIENAQDDRKYHLIFSSSWAYGEWFNPTKDLLTFIQGLPKTEYCGLRRSPVTTKEPIIRRLQLIKYINKHKRVRNNLIFKTFSKNDKIKSL